MIVNTKESTRVNEDWLINYPKGIIKYNDILRHKLLGYDEITDVLHAIYKKHNIKRVIDIGCGTGTLLMKLYQKGFECYGIDRNEESIEIARRIAKNNNLSVEFEVADALDFKTENQYDAVASMFVPFSHKSQLKMVKNMHNLLKPDGVLTFMLLEGLENNKTDDAKMILHFSENADTKVTRFEPWEKKGDFLQWNPVLLIQDGDKFLTYMDHDELEIFDEAKLKTYYQEISDVGFEIVDTIYFPKRISAPPWTVEVIVTAIKK